MYIAYRHQWDRIKESISIIKANFNIDSISPTLVELLIAAEDHRYNFHWGVDPIALCRAIWRTLFYGKLEGGSTIAMQLVRVITEKYEKSISRKILEIYLAIRISRFLSKNELPKIYLAIAYYGWNMNGLTQACLRLGLDSSDISQRDAARIIARLKYPEPKICNERRENQISIRAKYIIYRLKT